MTERREKNGSKASNRSTPRQESDADDVLWSFITSRSMQLWFPCIALFAVLIRLAVALHPYSGEKTPPMFGDYEAQRHWMEVTVNLPVKEWYRNSTANNMGYWGLDYPPLTAYQSYFHGLMLNFFDPASVLLHSSRGYESYIGKLLMRWTVLMSDLVIFFPSVIFFLNVYHSAVPNGYKNQMAWHTVMILCNPCLILIDHGHFQYNCISLGLTVAAVAAILSNRNLFGSMLFCLALNHKQMSAYYAPAFFAYLLGRCIRRPNPILEILKLALVVFATFAVIWWPYLGSFKATFEVISRLAPFERGIYEDYVANFWCATSIIVKWKKLFPSQSLKLLSLAATISACLPSMIHLIISPTRRGFLLGLLNSSLAFYLFSFQVHEKSILLPLLPASFLAVEEPYTFLWLVYAALLSMFPLLRRDNLVIPYIALCALFGLLYHPPDGRIEERVKYSSYILLKCFTFGLYLSFHIVYLFVSPPNKYPFLFEAFIMIFCFSQFLYIAFELNIKQWKLSKTSAQVSFKKKSV